MIRYFFFLLIIPCICFAQTHPYRDLSHDSQVFGRSKPYRIYLPEGYDQSTRRYPVVYFFHGNKGRYFQDPSAKPEYELLGRLVDKYQVIMVMWDGRMDESDTRPYNTGDHEHVKYQVQMKDYFPEIVAHIDSNFRTLADRDHRGIIGFSMGGFMSMVMAGKYPDKVSAITNMVGSPEFFLGYPDNHTLFPLRYLFDNLKDVAVRMHNMDNCPLVYLNNEIIHAAQWEGKTNFEYWMGQGDHKVDDPGETKVFETALQFVVNRFHHPVAPLPSWSHYDIYPAFDLWGYSVKSDKEEPGFLYLRNVSPAGFGFYSRKWLPDGPPFKKCTATVTTAPIYQKGKMYQVALYRQGFEKPILLKKKADMEGHLQIELTGDGYEVSISPASRHNEERSNPSSRHNEERSNLNDFVVLSHQLDSGKRYIRINDNNQLSITLLQRGSNTGKGKKAQLTVTCADPSVTLSNAVQELAWHRKSSVCQSQAVGIFCTKTPPDDASPPWIKLNVAVRCGNDVFFDAITVPVFYDVPYFSEILIDDGIDCFVPRNDGDVPRNDGDVPRNDVKTAMGAGNGNGYVEASEQIMIYENGQRLRLYTDDPYVETEAEILHDQLLQGIWSDGFRLSSIVKIADHCPAGHTIEFLSNYETEERMPIRRIVHWGKVSVTVK